MAIFRDEKIITQPSEQIKPTTVIGHGINAEGDINGAGDIVIEGKVKGKITTSGKVRIGQEADIHADIFATNILIAGKVHGNINSKESIEISASGQLTGNIKAKNISIIQGAIFNGTCQMGEEYKEIAKK